MTPHIALVEDDAKLAAMMAKFLRREQFSVTVIEDGAEAVDSILSLRPDLVILDIQLPGVDGIEICRQLRRGFSNPIIMLTARDDDFVEVSSLDQGADSFLNKPIKPHVLLAHVKAMLRRDRIHTRDEQDVLSVQDVSLDEKNYQARRGGETIELTTAEFELLRILMAQAGETLSRNDLYQQTRGIEYDGLDRSIDLRVSCLRRKLQDEQPPYRYIKTIRNKGYLFATA